MLKPAPESPGPNQHKAEESDGNLPRWIVVIGNWKGRLEIPMPCSFEMLFAGPDLAIEHIFSRRKGADELIVIGTGRMIGQIEI